MSDPDKPGDGDDWGTDAAAAGETEKAPAEEPAPAEAAAAAAEPAEELPEQAAELPEQAAERPEQAADGAEAEPAAASESAAATTAETAERAAAARRRAVWGIGDSDPDPEDKPRRPAPRRDPRTAVLGEPGERRADGFGQSVLIAGGIGAGLLLIALFIVLGYFNSKGFYFVCEANRISAERGRWVPWGHAPMDGQKWKPIAKPPATRCADAEFETEAELERAFATALMKQANGALAGATRERLSADALKAVDEQLTQALLLLAGSKQADQRKEIERLQGDVEYWRASAEVREAIARLGKAADKFDQAAARGPRHSADADTWATFARETTEELKKGPRALRPEDAAAAGATGKDAGAADKAGGHAEPRPDGGKERPIREGGEGVEGGEADGGDAAKSRDAGPPPIPRGGVLL